MKIITMPKFICFIVLAALSLSCAGPQTVARKEVFDVKAFDFSKYTDQGFLITPEEYLDDYQSIGIITVTQWPAVHKQDRRVQAPNSPDGYKLVEEYFSETIDVKKTVEKIYQEAKAMGADAITNFKVTSTSRQNGNLRVQGVEISGFAIKRK